MKYIGGRVFALFFVVLISSSVLNRDAFAKSMSDPLLGLSYDVAQITFEEFDMTKDSDDNSKYQQKWIFSHYDNRADDVYIISGFIKIKPDGPGKEVIEPDFGLVVRVKGNVAEPLGVPDRLFGHSPILSSNVIDALMADAAQRYLKAFGSLKNLQQEVDAQNILANDLPSIVRKQFEKIGLHFK